MRRAGEVHSKREILAGVWEFDYDGDPNIVEVYVRRLRRKLDEPFGADTITTVRGAGYRLDDAVRLVPTTLRWRVTAVATAAIVVVLVAVGWGLVVNHRRQLTDNLDELMAEIADGVAADVRAGDRPDLDRLGEDDWVVQVVAANGEVIAASAPIDDLPSIGPAVDGQTIRSIGPLPGGDDDPMRLLSRSVETPDGQVMVHVAAPRDDITDSVATLRRSLLVAVPVSAVALGAADVGARRAHAASGRADAGRGRRLRWHRP